MIDNFKSVLTTMKHYRSQQTRKDEVISFMSTSKDISINKQWSKQGFLNVNFWVTYSILPQRWSPLVT